MRRKLNYAAWGMLLLSTTIAARGSVITYPGWNLGTELASVTVTIPQTETQGGGHWTKQCFTDTYNLLVTGGTGDGDALLNLTLFGTTYWQSLAIGWDWDLEGSAQVTDFVNGVRNRIYYTPVGIPEVQPNLTVAFTYGVPETLELTGYAVAGYGGLEPGQSYRYTAGVTIGSAVFFNGITDVLQNRDAQISLTLLSSDPTTTSNIDAPEPFGLSWLGGIFLCCLRLLRQRRTVAR